MMELRADPCSIRCSSAEVAAPTDDAPRCAAAAPDASATAENTMCCCDSAAESTESPDCSSCRKPQTMSDWLRPAAVRRRYRELSMAVHPDKCSHPLADKVDIAACSRAADRLLDPGTDVPACWHTRDVPFCMCISESSRRWPQLSR